MKPMTRRNVLMLGGAAGAAALGASDALGNEAGAAPTEQVICKVYINDKCLRIRLEDDDTYLEYPGKDETEQYVSVPYWYVDGGKKYRCRFPWAKHQGMSGSLSDGKFPPHEFRFTAVKDKNFYKVSLSVDHASRTGTADCCFMCGGQEICIGPGQSFVCDGVEIICPPRAKQ
jgi:hypothetical protein